MQKPTPRDPQGRVRDPIAIVGLACRLPGAARPAALWDLVRSGRDALAGGTTGGRLGGLEAFDAAFFGMSPREAERLDPQHRLLLELSWEALEDAGIVPSSLAGTDGGVFAGIWTNDYEARLFADAEGVDFHAIQGTGRYAAAGRISHVLGLRGPSLTLDTGCSSSLVAVHLACRSLWSGETSVALAAGANVVLEPQITTAYTRAGMLSADGRCRFGDARGSGYVRSDGAGVVVLKRLSEALAAGDRVYAVILGGAVNNDGGASGSFGRPAEEGQRDLLRKAYADAGVEPARATYVEVHGTGTRAGDPVELSALAGVLCEGRSPDRPLLTGSIKTNIGHTEATAGVAALIKVALSLHHGEIPPSLHFEEPSPAFAWEDAPLTVVRAHTPWPEGSERIAGVSSFGIGGTNAHIVLGAAPAAPEESEALHEGALLLTLSGRSAGALAASARDYAALLAHTADDALRDVCASALLRREHHPVRAAIATAEPAELRAAVDALANGADHPALRTGAAGARPRIAFVFPGQGSQWAGMGLRLRATEPAFAHALDACSAAIRRHTGWALEDVLGDDDALARIDVVQPALFAIEVALAALWRSWGIEPAAVVGHSMGEVAAAYVAGALDLDAAAAIICSRSALLRRVSGRGGMALVELSYDDAQAALQGREAHLSVAVSNSPRATVIAGDVDALDALLAELDARGVFCRRVRVDVASHSPQVDPLLPELANVVSHIRAGAPAVRMISTVTGDDAADGALSGDYWVRNLREPVRFGDAVARLAAEGIDAFVEISPNPILLPSIEQCLPYAGATLAGSLRRDADERAVLLDSLAALYVAGADVKWQNAMRAGRRVALPTYPWQRERHWYEAPARAESGRTLRNPLLGPERRSGDGVTRAIRLDASAHAWLSEHRVRDVAVVPAAAMLELVTAAAVEHAGAVVALEDVEVREPIRLDEGGAQDVLLELAIAAGKVRSFRITSGSADARTVHATGSIRSLAGVCPKVVAPQVPETADADDVYAAFARRGLVYGPAFRAITGSARAGSEVVAKLEPDATLLHDAHALHPCVLDAVLQTALIAAAGDNDSAETLVPVAIARTIVHRNVEPGRALVCTARATTGSTADVTLFCGDEVVAELRGVRFASLDAAGAAAPLYGIRWQVVPPAATHASPRHWLIVADSGDAAFALALRLEAEGERCTLIEPVALGCATSEQTYASLLERTFDAGEPFGVVHLRSLDECSVDERSTAEALAGGSLALDAAHLVAALARRGEEAKLVLVTRGVDEARDSRGVIASTLWGLGATAAAEHPELACTVVDVPIEPEAADIAALARECRAADGESRVVLRNGERAVARLERTIRADDVAIEPLAAAPSVLRAEAGARRTLDGLTLRAAERVAPGPGQVEIEVAACGLNFMNVLSALGSCPGYDDGVGPLGLECSGRVVRVGEGVTEVQVGEEVVAVAFDCLGTHAVADAGLVARRPASLSHADAAALPIALLTAHYALVELARLRAGERVLIHSAAGGVGMAAVQLARRLGAEVIATAGSEAKRALLRAQGIEHVFDSRSTDFASHVLAATEGRGVDVVLNSLTGAAITAGLSALAPYGRFVEIGKRDIYDDAAIGLAPFRRNLSYFAVDLDRMARERPAVVGSMLRELIAGVERGEIEPLPVRAFGIDTVADAFRTMAAAEHTGKLAIELSPEAVQRAQVFPAPPRIRADGTYVISGGLGALGLIAARVLARRGARSIVLLGRSAPSPEAAAAIRQLEAAGVNVVVLPCDVSDARALARTMEDIRRTLPPLRGVVHAAGLLDDATLVNLDDARMRRVLSPKAAGAWNLHALTAGDALDLFVLFSSVSPLLGLAGQANYAAANAALDALARHRRAQGLPALSIAWGPWSDIGLAAADSVRGERLAAQGLGGLAPRAGEALLDRLIGEVTPTHVCAMSFDVAAWCRTHGVTPLLAELHDASAAGEAKGHGIVVELSAMRPAERNGAVAGHIAERVAAVLRMPRERVRADVPLRTLGLDSLLTLELRNRLEADLGLRLSATLIWNHPTISALAAHLVSVLFPAEAVLTEAPPTEADAADPEDDLSALVAAELARVEALLSSAESANRPVKEQGRVEVG